MTSSQTDRLGIVAPVRVFTGTAPTCQLALSDGIVEINAGTTAWTAVLPTYGGPYTIVDGANVAEGHPITVKNATGTSVGTIATNGGSASFAWDGTRMLEVDNTTQANISSVMLPVVRAETLLLATQALSTTGDGLFGGPTAMGLGVATEGFLNGIIGQVKNNLPPATTAFPSGVTGHASVVTAGNSGFGVFGQADLATYTVPGTAIGAEFDTFNYASGPSGVQPADLSFGTTDFNCNAVQVAAYGNYQSSIGYAVLRGSQQFQYGIYVHPQAPSSYGMLIDADPTHMPAGAGAVIRTNGAAPALILQAAGTPIGSAGVLVVADGAGNATANLDQNGDFINSGFVIGAAGLLNFKTATLAATASTGAIAIPATCAGFLSIEVHGTIYKLAALNV